MIDTKYFTIKLNSSNEIYNLHEKFSYRRFLSIYFLTYSRFKSCKEFN